MKWLTKNALLFSVKTCIAAFLALYIALELNLDKPAWSMVSVYVISQLYSASTLSKATYRFLGTVLGGVFIFLVYPFTVTDPVLFSLSVSLWVAFCLYLSLHDRTPKGYVFMLAGYSAAIMGFADVDTPMSRFCRINDTRSVKLNCLFFRQSADKTVLPEIIRPRTDAGIALCVSYAPVQFPPESSVPA